MDERSGRKSGEAAWKCGQRQTGSTLAQRAFMTNVDAAHGAAQLLQPVGGPCEHATQRVSATSKTPDSRVRKRMQPRTCIKNTKKQLG